MTRVMQWANFKGNGGDVVSYPMLVDEAGGLKMRGPVPQDSELISVTPAYAVWVDEDGAIVDGAEDPDTKTARQDAKKAERDAWGEKKAQALKLAAKGFDRYEIAAKVGASPSTIKNWLLVADARE